MSRNRQGPRQAQALAIAEDRAGQEVVRAMEEAEDPVVAYDLILIRSLSGNLLVTVMTKDLYVAKEVVFVLQGPYTTKDFNFRPIRRSEREDRKRRV